MVVLEVPSAAHKTVLRQGGAVPWSLSPVLPLALATRREGGLGGKERSNSRLLCGPLAGCGCWCQCGGPDSSSIQKLVLWHTQRPARALALTVWDGALLSWHIQGTLFKWRHLCCCHKGGVVLS